MPNELESIAVTRPTSFNPDNDYAEVIARGGDDDIWLGDYDLNDLQKIQRYDQAAICRLVFVEGALLFESGGAIGTPIAGVGLSGGDTLASAGIYRGIQESQVYTVLITTPGPAGTARYTYRSTGSDNPELAGLARPITAIAPSLAVALDAPNTYGHPVGTLGVVVYFINPTGSVNASSWIILATYGERPPVVTKGSPDAGHDTIRCYDALAVIQGSARRAREALLTVTAATTGITVIYGEWTRRIITHVEDPGLVDPLSDTPQACRMQHRLVYRATDTSGLSLGAGEVERRVFPLYLWNRATNVVTRAIEQPFAIDIGRTQGALSAERLFNVDQNQLLRGILARRDHGAHGDYVVSPRAPEARATLSTNAASIGKRRLALAPSAVSVEGLEVFHEDPVEIEIDQASEFMTVQGEPHTYNAAAVAAGGFYLNKSVGERVFPIRQVSLLKAHVAVGTAGSPGSGWEQHTRGSNDTLVYDIIGVPIAVNALQGGAGTVFSTGTGANQWTVSGNTIVWGGSSSVTTYFVRYIGNRALVKDTDFVLNADGFVTFAPAGIDPITDGIVTVDYTAFLPRVDAILVRPSGDYLWVKGLAAEVPLLPGLPPRSLPYVRVELGAGPAGVVRCISFDNDAIHMTTMNRLVRAVTELTQNDVYQDLHNQLRDKTTGNPIDILAEAFATTDQADLAYNTGGIVCDALIDTELGEMTVGFTQAIYAPTRETSGLPAGETAVRVGGDFFTLPFTHELAIAQDMYSREYPVNPYASFAPEDPEFLLTPSQDFFVDTANQTVTVTAQIRKLQALKTGLISGQEAARLLRDFRAKNGRVAGRGEVLGNLDAEVVSQFVQTLPALYMRRITLTVTGLHCLAGEKVRAKFDGKDVPLAFVPASGTTQGAGGDADAVICSPAVFLAGDVVELGGTLAATFLIPANVPVGTRQLVLYGNRAAGGATWNSANPASGGYVVLGSVPYTSNGSVRTTITEERVLQVIKEPIAQSFTFPEARMVSRVEIPFATKGLNGSPPLVFQLRGTELQGQASRPTGDILASITRDAANVNVGAASLNQFDPVDPVLCFPNEFRAIMLRSASNAYQVYVATLSQPNLASGGRIDQQALPGGIFMDSENNVDWTLRQESDLRCKIYVAKFSATAAVAYLTRISHTDVTGFTANIDQVLPDGTSIDWEYSVDAVALNGVGKVWRSFVPFVPVEVPANADGSIPDVLDIRGTLRTTSLYVSPGFHRRNLSVHVTTNATTATYVSKAKALTGDGTGAPLANGDHIAGIVDLIEITGGSKHLYISIDDGAHWREATLTPTDVRQDGFTHYTYDLSAFSTDTGKALRTRLELTTPSKALRPRARALGAYAVPV